MLGNTKINIAYNDWVLKKNITIEKQLEGNMVSKKPVVTCFSKEESSKTEIPQTPELKSVFCLSDTISHDLPLTTLFLDKVLA
jgi:hypothetical protein